jgi:uncharacterized membrane protein YfcA
VSDTATARQQRLAPLASMLGAGVGGFLLLVVTLPFLVLSALPPVLDPEVPPHDPPAAVTTVVATLLVLGAPTLAATVIAWRQRANVRVTVLLVAVPQVVLCAPLLSLRLWA